MTEQRDDPTYHPPPPASPDVRQKRSVGAVAHLASVIVAVVLVPIAYLLLDFAMREMRPRVFGALDESALPPKVWVSVCAASGLMVIAAGIGRLSGLGPLVAGLLWGALPTVVTLLRPLWIPKRLVDLPDIYDFIGFQLSESGLFVYPDRRRPVDRLRPRWPLAAQPLA